MTYNFIDLTGKKINRWTFIRHVGYGKWIARCSCGSKKQVLARNVREGKSKSCGCYRSENPNNKTHGMTRTPIYFVWRNMLNRCYHKSTDSYHLYGARGIKVCDRWKNSFENFYEDMGDGYKKGLSIDRVDVDRDYEPDNCGWATNKMQGRNKRNNHLYKYNGESKTIGEWAEIYGFKKNTLTNRVGVLGWSIKKAIETPINTRKRNKRFIFDHNTPSTI